MTIQERKKSLKSLGKFLSQFSINGSARAQNIPNNDLFFPALNQLIDRAHESNAWFTKANVLFALSSWADALKDEKIDRWFDMYNLTQTNQIKTVGVVMAGNIPLVGFHDFISVLMSGHRIKAKLSSNDRFLLPMLAKYLEHLSPEFKELVVFTDTTLSGIDAVIATGSNNTARYFSYYFGKYPHIIRHNRNSVAVLDGSETEADLSLLSDDIMLYFGLGCRNVSKLLVPENYDFNPLFKALLKYKDMINYTKYANNYDYNKAVYLMSVDASVRNSLLDNGLLLLKQDVHYASPIGAVFYEYYKQIDDVKQILNHDAEKIQAIISHLDLVDALPFGSSQFPQLWDYADGVDTIQFLLNL